MRAVPLRKYAHSSCGPGSVNALGLVTLTAPSAGMSGLPKPPAARAAAVSVANPPAASIVRRERFALIMLLTISTKDCFWGGFMSRDYQFPAFLQCLVPSHPQAIPFVLFFSGIAICIRAGL